MFGIVKTRTGPTLEQMEGAIVAGRDAMLAVDTNVLVRVLVDALSQ